MQRHTNNFFDDEYAMWLLGDLNTLAPGKVIKYDESRHRADIQPLFLKKHKDQGIYKQDPIREAPVLKHVEPDIKEGCLIFYVCAQRSLENLDGINFVDPDSHQLFDQIDAVVIGVFDG